MDFKTICAERIKDKGNLCVGLDPSLPEQHMQHTIPEKFTKDATWNEARLAFCLEMIDLVKDFAVAVKPNQQFIFGFTVEDHITLTKYAKEAGLLILIDYKENDIGNTVQSTSFYIGTSGYNATTYNPLMGNIEESVKMAHLAETGLIVLTLTSNKEGETYFRNAIVDGHPMFHDIAQKVNKFDADGCVVGATGHVIREDVETIVRLAGQDKILLCPGIGAQGGDEDKFKGFNALVNVGREIIYNTNPGEKAKFYADRFKTTLR